MSRRDVGDHVSNERAVTTFRTGLTVVTSPSVWQCGVTVIAAPRYRLRWSDGIQHRSAVATTDACNTYYHIWALEVVNCQLHLHGGIARHIWARISTLHVPHRSLRRAAIQKNRVRSTKGGPSASEPSSASEAAQWLTRETTQHQRRSPLRGNQSSRAEDFNQLDTKKTGTNLSSLHDNRGFRGPGASVPGDVANWFLQR